MDLEMIIIMEALKTHEDGIMQFTLGGTTIDEDETIKITDIYTKEWSHHRYTIAKSIKNIIYSKMSLTPDMIVGIIVSEWFGYVGCDVSHLNYYGLLGVAIEIINYIEKYSGECNE